MLGSLRRLRQVFGRRERSPLPMWPQQSLQRAWTPLYFTKLVPLPGRAHTHTHYYYVSDITIAPFPRRAPPVKSFVAVPNKSLVQVSKPECE